MRKGQSLLLHGELVTVLDAIGDEIVVESSQWTSLSRSDCYPQSFKVWTGTKWRKAVPVRFRVVIWGEEFLCLSCKRILDVKKRAPSKRDECLFCFGEVDGA